MHCGTANYSYQDARRTAGNTNDYNGKMLRIHPDPAIPGRRQARRSGRTAPTRSRAPTPRTARTCSTAPRRAARTRRRRAAPSARSTRWACATRAACRSIPRPTSRTRRGSGPDAGAPSVDAGPVDLRERRPDHARRQLWLAVLHGQQAGRTATARSTRTCAPTAPPATCRAARPTGGTEGWYDCDNLRNDSPNNTGLVVFPHQTGTGADAGKVRGNNVWYSRGNKDGHNGCPDFERPRGATAAPNYDATPTRAVSVRGGRRHDDHGRPGLPLHAAARTTPSAGPSTGTAAGSCTTTAARRSSTA